MNTNKIKDNSIIISLNSYQHFPLFTLDLFFCFSFKLNIIDTVKASLFAPFHSFHEGYSFTNFNMNYSCECFHIFAQSTYNIVRVYVQKSVNIEMLRLLFLESPVCEVGPCLASENLNFRKFPPFPELGLLCLNCINTLFDVEHLLSFWESGIWVCRAEVTYVTTPNKNLGYWLSNEFPLVDSLPSIVTTHHWRN